MIIQNTRFGDLEIDDRKIITFPFGLPGFEQLTKWYILHPEGQLDISWFQSAENPDVALLTTDPDVLFPDYDVEVNERDLGPIGVRIATDNTEAPSIAMRVVVTVEKTSNTMTANLRAPILINLDTRLGMQLPLIGSTFSVRHPLIVPENPKDQTHNSQKMNGRKGNGLKGNGLKGNGLKGNGQKGNGQKENGQDPTSTEQSETKPHAVANS